jgi:D-lactate dehydrogenase
VESVVAAARVDGVISIEAARNREEAATLWSIRKALSPALRRVAPKKINEDVVVPVSRIPELVTRLEQLSSRYSIQIVNFGHAGNGNLHVNLMYDPSDGDQQQRASACLEAVFATVLEMGGTLSGEHGIGLVKRDWVGRELDETSLRLMRAIKSQFDPEGILNPGKTLPPDSAIS